MLSHARSPAPRGSPRATEDNIPRRAGYSAEQNQPALSRIEHHSPARWKDAGGGGRTEEMSSGFPPPLLSRFLFFF